MFLFVCSCQRRGADGADGADRATIQWLGPRQAKVTKARNVVFVQQDVGGLDITMNLRNI
jgi:hypothetical protein